MQEADLIFQDIPWDLIYDDDGELIGEVYLILPDPRMSIKGGKTI
ncbi:hypothetical protein ABDI30_12015 [Paenibacillus cisolokensis]